MTDGGRIVTLVQSMQRERDDAIEENKKLKVKIWELEEELRQQKEETERWKKATPQK